MDIAHCVCLNTSSETHIIFLAFLLSRRGLASVHRAFPSVQVVTAAIDPDLHEMHFPTSASLSQVSAGDEADLSIRLIDDIKDMELDDYGRLQEGPESPEKARLGLDDGEEVKHSPDGTVPAGRKRSQTEELKFSRPKRGEREETMITEKRAWVVSPGTMNLSSEMYQS